MSSKRPGVLKILGIILLIAAFMEAIVVCVIWSNPAWRKLATDWVVNPDRETRKVAQKADSAHWDEKLFDFNVSNYPNLPEVYLQRAQYRSLKGKYKEAIEDCDHALALSGKSESIESGVTTAFKPITKVSLLSMIYSERAEAKMHLSQLPDAAADFDKAVQSDAASPRIYSLQADCYLRMNDFKKAIRSCTNGIKNNPKSAVLFSWRADARDRNKEPELAVNDIDTAIALDPESASYYVQKCSYLSGKDDAKALIAVDKAIDLNPDRVTAYDWKISILLRQKRYDEALAAADKGIEHKPHNRRLKHLKEKIATERASDKGDNKGDNSLVRTDKQLQESEPNN
jgi:tetratricopeptide (TPR) repeat protein